MKFYKLVYGNMIATRHDGIFSAMSAEKMSVSVCVCPWLRENIQDAVTDGELIYERS